MNPASAFIKIIKELGGKEVLVVSNNYSNTISEKRFKNLKNMDSSSIPVYGVDGGCAVVADGGGWIYSKIKTCVIGYKNHEMIEKNIKNYYYGCINLTKDYKDALISEEKTSSIDLSRIHKKNSIDEMPAKVMKLLEWEECLDLLKKIDKGIILMDSGFQPDNKTEEEIIKRIKKLSIKKKVRIIGFCKTSRIRTNTGRSFLGVLKKISEERNNPWIYHPVFKEKDEDYETGIVKMNNRGKYCNKINFFEKKNILKYLNNLTFYSSDKELLGYPYPLLKADKLGRVSDYEKKSELRRFKLTHGSKELINDLLSQSFHEELDKRRYK